MVSSLKPGIPHGTILGHNEKSIKFNQNYDHRLSKIQQKLTTTMEYTDNLQKITYHLKKAREKLIRIHKQATELRMEFLWDQAVAYEIEGNLKAHQQIKKLMQIETQIRRFNKIRKSFKKN